MTDEMEMTEPKGPELPLPPELKESEKPAARAPAPVVQDIHVSLVERILTGLEDFGHEFAGELHALVKKWEEK